MHFLLCEFLHKENGNVLKFSNFRYIKISEIMKLHFFFPFFRETITHKEEKIGF